MASTRAQGFTAFSFSLGGLSGGLANAGVLIVGIWLGLRRARSPPARCIAFAFLVSLFVMPVQMGTQILTEAQNAIAGWRRVIGILETPADLVDPGPERPGAAARTDRRRVPRVTFAYPDGPTSCTTIDMHIASGTRVAIVGETGSGKSTFAKLLTRLMDPRAGAVLLDGIDLREMPAVLAAPVGGAGARRRASCSTTRCGPTPATAGSRPPTRRSSPRPPSSAWPTGSTGCRAGSTPGSASAASRCRRASGSWSRCCRAHLADPDLLVLDEATSAVDPNLEMRIGRALERLMHGPHVGHHRPPDEHRRERRRGAWSSTAGRIVQRGPHAALVEQDGVYAGTWSWVAQQGRD